MENDEYVLEVEQNNLFNEKVDKLKKSSSIKKFPKHAHKKHEKEVEQKIINYANDLLHHKELDQLNDMLDTLKGINDDSKLVY